MIGHRHVGTVAAGQDKRRLQSVPRVPIVLPAALCEFSEVPPDVRIGGGRARISCDSLSVEGSSDVTALPDWSFQTASTYQ